MSYNTLAFTIHRKCSAACSMCCFESNPSCKEKLEVERIKSYIDEASEINEIEKVSFTGGEPFMEYDLLVYLIDYSSRRGLRATTITNGYWATSYEKAYKMLKKLKDVGLKHLSISHDSYHQEYIKTEFIRNLLKATTALKIQTTMAMVKIKDEKVGHIIDEIGESIYSSDLQIVPCLSVGGAKKTFTDEQFDRTIETKCTHCTYNGNFVVAYDGSIYPCCSQVIFESGLSIGNFSDMTLKDALQKVKNNALLYLIRNKDLTFFTDYAKDKLGIQIPDKVVNSCELCGLLFKKENLKDFYPFIIEKIEEEQKKVKVGA